MTKISTNSPSHSSPFKSAGNKLNLYLATTLLQLPHFDEANAWRKQRQILLLISKSTKRSGLKSTLIAATLSCIGGTAVAQVCTPNPPSPYSSAGTNVTCSVGTYNGKIGAPEGASAGTSGVNNGNYNNSTVTINAGSIIDSGNSSAVSLYNNALINIYGAVQNTSTTATGSYGTGGNTIEFNTNGTLNVYTGGSVIAQGSQNSAEAINVQGNSGTNTINNRGTIGTNNNSVVAIWNQSGSNLIIDNYGKLYSGNQSNTNPNKVIGGNSGSITFTNETGASVYGSLLLGGTANDTIILYTGSFLSGIVDGGSSSGDSLYLKGDGNQTLTNEIKNINNLYKQDAGTWTWSGTNIDSFHTFTSAEVQQGTLSVTGSLKANTFTVNNGGTLSGTGTVTGAVTNAGTIAPGLGNSAGSLAIVGNVTNNGSVNGYDATSNLSITGNYTQSSGGNFETHINSLSNYSKIIATGQLSMATGTKITADLNPTLKLNAGDVIPGVIQAATLAAPNAITVDTLSDRYKLLARYTGANVDLYLPASGVLNPYNSPGTYYGALQEQTLATVAIIQVPTLGVLHQRYALLNAITEYDCNKFDKYNFCISAQARATGFGTQATGAGVLNIAYRPIPQVHVGAFIDYQAAAGNPAANNSPIAVTLNNGGVQYGYDNPTFGGYAGFSQSGYSGNLINNGLQVMVSGAYNPGKVSVTRALIMNPYLPFVDAQPGSGNASLNSSVIRGMVGYGIALTDRATLMPYGGIRFTDVTRGAYMENYTAIVTQPLAYNSFYERLLTGFGGAMLNGKITDRFGAILGLGVETDLTRYANSLSGYSPIAIEYMTSFSFDHGGTWNGLRPTGNAGAYYDIAPNQRISLNGFAGQQAWTSRTYATGLLGYQVAF